MAASAPDGANSAIVPTKAPAGDGDDHHHGPDLDGAGAEVGEHLVPDRDCGPIWTVRPWRQRRRADLERASRRSEFLDFHQRARRRGRRRQRSKPLHPSGWREVAPTRLSRWSDADQQLVRRRSFALVGVDRRARPRKTAGHRLRYNAARWRAIARRDDDRRRKAGSRGCARRARRRHDRGGFPCGVTGRLRGGRLIATRVKGSTVAGLAAERSRHRTRGAGCARGRIGRIHTFIATSDIHLKHKLR